MGAGRRVGRETRRRWSPDGGGGPRGRRAARRSPPAGSPGTKALGRQRAALRDSEDPDGPVLVFTPAVWAAFRVSAAATPHE
ncbi:DUF397 domain-containing protein [Streptomyces abikoensis]|uniref:DUF397 domain-containing protein n=1 Tax=Streptomyces abikoensis TaxID=97398 RepID=UPI0033EE2AD5